MMNPIQWNKAARGVWQASAGQEICARLLDASAVAPRWDALERMDDTDFPFPPDVITCATAGEKMVLTFPCGPEEILYGLGLNFKSIEVQRTIRHLHVDHFGGEDNGRTHAPVPFFLSAQGYGVLINAARYISVYAGATHRKENHPPVIDRLSKDWKSVQPGRMVEVVVPLPGAEVLIFGGPTPLDAVRRFNLYCGGGCLPPRWGLGFWHRVPMRFSDREVEAEADQFAGRGFPLDVVGLEPGWHSQAYPTTYEWHPERFSEPKRFLDRMRAKGVRVNLWENCYIAPACSLGRKMEPFCASHTGGWGGLVPDLTLPAARALLTEQHEAEHLDNGASGYKLDECDGYDRWIWPDHATCPSGLTGEQLRQIYGVLLQRTTTAMYRKRNLRTYGLTRASNAGGVSFPYVIYNDHYDHRDFITALCSASFCGLLWTPEARASASGEEWLRRMQSVCLSPLAMINAWADGTKPWSFPEVGAAVQDVMLLRMRLAPYLYTAFARYYFDGTPPFRAMALENGFLSDAAGQQQSKLDSKGQPCAAPAFRNVKDQYMIGPSLLVAPLFAGQAERTLILPRGDWFDFYTGQPAGAGPAQIRLAAAQDKIPIFVRDGGIIPLMPPLRQMPKRGAKVDLELRHYGCAPGIFDLYDDDGETYNYEKGEFCHIRLTVEPDAAQRLQGSVTKLAGMPAFTYADMTWRFMTEAAP